MCFKGIVHLEQSPLIHAHVVQNLFSVEQKKRYLSLGLCSYSERQCGPTLFCVLQKYEITDLNDICVRIW